MLGMMLTVVAMVAAILAFVYLQLDNSSSGTPPPGQNSGVLEQRLDLHNLSHSARIWIIPNFLAPNEVKHILALAREAGWSNSPTAGKQFQLPRDMHGKWRKVLQSDKVIQRVEQRIARVTGIPAHPAEDMLAMARIKTRGGSPRQGNFPPFGLHHESDTRPWRVRTVLAYLTSVQDGGRTIFPAAPADFTYNSSGIFPQSDTNGRSARRKLEETLKGFMGQEDRGWQRQVTFDPHSTHPYMDMLEFDCRGTDTRGGHAVTVGVPPVAGAAIVFDSVLGLPDPLEVLSESDLRRVGKSFEPNPLTWHAGCNVLPSKRNKGRKRKQKKTKRENVKIILQKFKELPMRFREDSRVQLSPKTGASRFKYASYKSSS